MLSLGLFIFTIGAVPLTLMLSYKIVEPILYKVCVKKGYISLTSEENNHGI